MGQHRYRWIVGILLFCAGGLNYVDRAAMSVAAPFIRSELHITDYQMGLLFSAFFTGYCVFCFVGGWCADRFGPRRVFAAAASFWSLFCAATAAMSSFSGLLAVRVLFGIGEGPMGTTINKSITHWFPREEAARAVGFIAIGQPLGAAIAAPLIGFLALNYGWRVAFIVTGVLGLVWVLAWLRFFRDTPEQHPRVSPVEREQIAASHERAAVLQRETALAENASPSRGIWSHLLSKRVLAICIAFFASNYLLYFLLSWLPSYLVDFQHLNVREMAVVGAIPWLGAAIGLGAGGWISDSMVKRSRDSVAARKTLLLVALAGAAVLMVVTMRSQSAVLAVLAISGSSICSFMIPQNCWVLVREVVPQEKVGVTGGFVHLVANLAGLIAPGLTGWFVQYGGGYPMAFAVAAGLALCSALAIALLLHSPRTRSPSVSYN
ncbi:MFS transporter [Paraburkholderia acidisoli]|uniref:MFS transporter n=1 Tax=Paraburkholderia acidisoli TaxID=2571748 RepID=A0A7Z2JJP2_9BURK|nr:MFS transporter [Paraburkholderia acidisoli]QGZ65555.1 MFS transporter [Paraburkholderia acidisoli]